ncbi:sensor histidine kinase [Allokutzneria oryzae]|uniref:histidine kinase n=1 Tax=Allokutzneria oryzae TaxID=1378989 RepID=A0ABV5ZSX6_9PSEU
MFGQLRVPDGALAIGATALGLAIYHTASREHVTALTAFGHVVVVVGCVPLAWRRVHPLLVLGAVEVALATAVVAEPYLQGLLTPCSWLAVYSVAASPKPFPRLVFVLACTPAVAWALAQDDVSWPRFVFFAVQSLGITAAFWALGHSRRVRQAQQELLVERAAAEERAYVTRELHDVLASTLTGVVTLARGARDQPELAGQVLAEIERAGREGLTETREVLREKGNSRPGLDRLPDLVDLTRTAGVPVRLVVEGDPKGMPEATGSVAFRIAQEALTNAVRHGDGNVTIHIGHSAVAVDIEVTNSGSGHENASGLGLAGMADRVRALGGTFHAGPTAGGGWSVRARLPR